MKQEEKLCDEVKTVREFTYLGDMLSAGGGRKADVSARTICWWAKCRGCGELIYGLRFLKKPKGAAYKSYIRPAILHGSEAWCLIENEIS